ncbi:N-acetylmuramoyl-L-alanine amidase AmiD precursor [Thalassovita gelatinovora]|uniref:N-acetylmuramoyl-L-alanine amidase n=1 Tax=Thalassovita gelatinovora TaxID=53501 RepID=A0A0P1F8R9_THAGE|nr:N-acetylmuramoyl-L-alanine amidase AmiD precursor [Thalassovita gelatinovora]SEQ84107.1 N-acetylmuramoyl-L-alanine amidase [Thalassovita gelatinovora]
MADRPDPIPHPSPNFGPRRDGARPDLIVLHYTAMTSAEAALDRLCDPLAEVSAHYLICERGQIWQLVEEDMRAWHAGAGQWGAVGDINSRSIGIELANLGTHPFSQPQMAALEALLRRIMARWPIPPERVIGHSDMAPDRKYDPGARFDWQRLARQGLSIWPEAAEPGDFFTDAARFGYGIDRFSPEAVLDAFRLRFRPGVTGPLDETDRGLIADLAARFPVDQSTPTA